MGHGPFTHSFKHSFKHLLVVGGMIASTLVLNPAPVATAAETKPPAPRAVPPLVSAPLDVRPVVPVGDFSSPPPAPAQRSLAPPAPRTASDLSRSQLVDAETTPTRTVYDNPDGTRTAVVSQIPLRYRSEAGTWADIDLGVVATADALVARSAPDAARLGLTASANVAEARTVAGVVSLRYPGATPVAGAIEAIDAPGAGPVPSGSTLANQVRYPGALGSGRDLVLRPTAAGFEESVVLFDTSRSTYSSELVLAPGMGARQAGADVEILDASGVVVARYGGGVAYDSALDRTGPATAVGVKVRLVSLRARVATLETSVDATWLTDPARTLPVTIDPVFSTVTTSATDTFVYSGAPTTAYPTHPWLISGSSDAGATIYRSLLGFDTSALPTGANVTVLESHVGLFQWYAYAGSCAGRSVTLGGTAVAVSSGATWNTQPGAVASPGAVTSAPFAHHLATNWPCQGAVENIDTTAIARHWLTDAGPNHGLTLRAANEADTSSYKGFYAADGAPYPQWIPTLSITYNRPPGLSAPASPADGAVIHTTTPTLTATTATDPDGDAVRYWFRGTTTPDAETGAKVIDSGWLTSPSYTLAPGALADGETYSWHVHTWDGVVDGPSGSYGFGVAANSFAVETTTGASDSLGPVSVDLVSANVSAAWSSPGVAGVGGDLGVSLAYNSVTTTSGLTGRYYLNPDTTGVPTFAGKTPVLVRTDPNVNFNWGAASPAPGIGGDHFLVRWTGKLNVPTTAIYKFFTANDDGVRVWVGGVQVADRWIDESNYWNPACTGCGSVGLTANTPVDVVVEYYERTGSSFLTLGYTTPYTTPVSTGAVPADWLRPEPGATPPGWTLSPASAGVSNTRLSEASATLTDAAGHAERFGWNGSGWTPPTGSMARLTGSVTAPVALDAGGANHGFDSDGRLISITSGTDDTAPAAPRFTWSGSPLRLRSITDPLSARVVTLNYGGDADCGATPAGYTAPPLGTLCRIAYPAGAFAGATNTNATFLRYNSDRQLAAIEDPGLPADATVANRPPVTTFAYEAAGRLAKVRDPLVNEAIAAAVVGVPDDDTTRTLITYPAPGVDQAIKLAAPSAGVSRPSRSYTRPSDTETRVHVAGLTEPHGFARKVVFDTAGRVVSDTDGTNRTTTSRWDANDNVISVTDPAGRITASLYDASLRPTTTYGPALQSCFTGPDYQVLNGSCASVPTTVTGYDSSPMGVAGLGAQYWDNSTRSGAPKFLRTGLGTTTVSATWTSPPDPALPATWSARFSGTINLAAASNLELSGAGTYKVWVDYAEATPTTSAAAGVRHVVIDYAAPATGTPSLTLSSRPVGSGSFTPVANSVITPDYGLVTRTTVADTSTGSPPSVSAYRYGTAASPAAPDPATGLAGEVIVDPDGVALSTKTTYEALGPGFLRRTSRTLPAGNTTVHAPHGVNDTADDPCTAGTNPVNQSGFNHTTTTPDPDGTGLDTSIVTEAIYDVAGRVVATRHNTEAWTCMVYDARGRLASRSVPLFNAQAARTVTYNHAVGADPRVASVADATGTVTNRSDLLGRVVSHTDASPNPLLNTTATTYDQPGRPVSTTGPGLGWSAATAYDAANRVTSQSVDNVVVATPAYAAPGGELSGVTYANATTLDAIARNDAGSVTGLTWKSGATTLGSDTVTRSQSQRVLTETVDATVGSSFVYDSAGRLDSATVGTNSYSYGFAGSGGCGSLATAGLNTNRTSVTLNAGTPVTYCYDNADRLTSSSDTAIGTPAYDSHANTTTLGAQSLVFDGDNRHLSTVEGSSTVTYVRDATDRIISRAAPDGVSTYGYSGPGDSPAFVTSGLSTQRSFGLVGGVTLNKGGPTGDTWSYPNIHGDVMAQAGPTGTKIGATHTYDPYGQTLGTLPENSPGNFDYGWLGAHQRPTEHSGSITTIEMGARPYVPGLGRFLAVDPIEGGTDNNYVYPADPVNGFDSSGLAEDIPLPEEYYDPCIRYRGPQRDALYDTPLCKHYSMAYYNDDTDIYWDWLIKHREWDKPNKPNPVGRVIANVTRPTLVYGYGLRPAAEFVYGCGTAIASISEKGIATSASGVHPAVRAAIYGGACLIGGTVPGAVF